MLIFSFRAGKQTLSSSAVGYFVEMKLVDVCVLWSSRPLGDEGWSARCSVGKPGIEDLEMSSRAY
jgi:hypothetical protein